MDLRIFSIMAYAALISLSGSVFAKTQYISSPPLSQVVNSRVGEVTPGRSIQVPLITWGADSRTIFANGNQLNTAKGSIFSQLGLNLRLKREDTFTRQLQNYISGKTPYLRGTLGMIVMASDLLNRDARTRPVIIYQLSESAGGDALVVKKGIRKPGDLRGKTIVVQAYGPHVDYLAKILNDAGLTVNDVKIRWVADLTGSDNSPMAAFYDKNVDAAMVITPDALALTSGGSIGTGSESSVAGARILLSTKTANRIIADVYAVRSDYFKANRDKVNRFVRGLMLAQKEVADLVKQRNSKHARYQTLLRSSAKILLDSEQATGDAEAMYHDARHMSVSDNSQFFTRPTNPRRFQRRLSEISASFRKLGLIQKNARLQHANWDYGRMGAGIGSSNVNRAQFNKRKLATTIARKQQQGSLKDGEIFSFEVFFKPNQKSFSADLYSKSFDKVIDLASTYGGAVITVEGHSDPLGYLKRKKAGASNLVLRRLKQSAKNLSLTRATAVRNSIIDYAKNRNITLDSSQFAIVGHGINNPKTGICGQDPCAPRTEREWRDNMRVKFRIIQLEAESDVFKPL